MTDWTDPSTKQTTKSGAKAIQLKSEEDRLHAYREFRKEMKRNAYVCDLDQVEWRIVNGRLRPVAVLEMTRIDGDGPVRDTYLSAIIDRMFTRDAQGNAVVSLGKSLMVPVYVVAFLSDLSAFWIWDCRQAEWKRKLKDEYVAWLENLKPVVDWNLPLKRDVSEIIWAGRNAVIYKDLEGKIWRYLSSYNAEWPVEIVDQNSK